MRVQIHANVRIRRIYFSDRLYGDDEMPNEFKLFLPVTVTASQKRDGKAKEPPPAAAPLPEQKRDSKQADVPPPTQEAVPVEEVEVVVEKIQLDETSPSGAPPTPIEVESPPESPAMEDAGATSEAEPVVEVKEGEEGQAEGEGESPAAGEVTAEGGEEAAKEGPPAESAAEEGPPAEGPSEEGPPAESAEEPPAESPPAESAAPEENAAGKLSRENMVAFQLMI